MEEIEPPTREPDHQNSVRSEVKADLDSPDVWPELDALVENNQQLKKLVTQLSELVIRNVVDRP
jgi:hypothetical protein